MPFGAVYWFSENLDNRPPGQGSYGPLAAEQHGLADNRPWS